MRTGDARTRDGSRCALGTLLPLSCWTRSLGQARGATGSCCERQSSEASAYTARRDSAVAAVGREGESVRTLALVSVSADAEIDRLQEDAGDSLETMDRVLSCGRRRGAELRDGSPKEEIDELLREHVARLAQGRHCGASHPR